MGLVCKKIRQIFLIAHHQYAAWMLNGKQAVVFVILFFFMQYVSEPLAALSVDTGIPLQWAETFLSAVNSPFMLPVMLFCFMALMSEFPKRDYEDTNIFFCTKRANWYYGQILFSIYAVLTFLGETAGLFVIRTAKISYPANGWSPMIRYYMERYLEMGRGYGVVAVVPSEVFNHFAPDNAFFYTLLLLAGMLLEMGFIMFLFNLLDRKTVGIVINVLSVVLGIGMIYMKSKYLKLVPVGNAVLQCQNRPVTRLTQWYEPVLYFLISNIVLVIIGRIRIRRVQL